ncbi:fascin domain-containing protein [Nakamurella multipartita]|uniref:fascin domain-containing protein n=1 Tax=Nakamurella multipartita TaxID=53461 RepID=UPI0010FCDD02|nr:hypothetical protein [Nakamurella multipartita]
MTAGSADAVALHERPLTSSAGIQNERGEPTNGAVALRAEVNGRYVVAENAGQSPLIANRSAVGPWESFDMIQINSTDIALRAQANRKYVCAESGGANPLISNRDAAGAWETFQLIHNSDGTVSLRSRANGRIVTAESAGDAPLIANRTDVGPWEKFTLVQLGTSQPNPGGAASPVIDAAWPTPDSTGPRQSSQRTTGNLSSSAAGELISRVTVAGRLTIRHDNVTVRDVTVNGTGTYMIQVLKKSDGTCPRNVRIEYTEINGTNAAENDIPLYSPDCGYVFDHGYIHNVGRTSRLVNDTTISNSYVFSNRTGSSGAHRGAVGTNGGNNNQIINNVLMCEGVGCSAAIPMYGDFMPVTGLLVQHNLLATTGSYCAYGGSVDSKPYPNGSNIRFIDNHFSTRYFPTCGRYGPITGFDNGVRGNVWTGNVWHETGRAASAN